MSYRKTRGAISVFLVIVLVPCMVLTSVFVDLGRTFMSKNVAKSSADLALNTLMTNYDADLSEWYGLIASCQNIDEYYDTATQYFLRSMTSKKIEGYEATLLSDYAQAAFDKTEISDLLLCDVQSAPSDIISPVPGANLSSSGLMKVQIIEFMKYRAPIEILRGLFGRLQNSEESEDNGGGTDQAEDRKANQDAAKDETHVANKQAYYEAEGELDGAAFHSYIVIRQFYRDGVCDPYDKNQNSAPMDNQRLREYSDKINSYRTAYAAIHEQYVEYFAATDGLSTYNRPIVKASDYDETEPEKVFKKDNEEKYYKDYFSEDTQDGKKVWTITGVKYHELLDELKKSVEEFDKTRDELGKAATELLNQPYGPEQSDKNEIQWWVRLNQAINATSGTNLSKKVREAGEKMMLLAMEVRLAESDKVEITEPYPEKSTKPDQNKTPEEKEHERDVHDRAEELLKQVDDRQEKYLTAGKTNAQDVYLYTVNQLEKVSRANIDKIDPNKATVVVDGQTMYINNALDDIATNLSGMKAKMDFMVEKLNLAINGDGGDIKSMNELEALADKYHRARDAWSGTAAEGDTTMKQYDQKALNGELTGDDAVMNVSDAAKKITASAVRTLRARLVNIKGQLEKVSKAIEGFTYGGVSVAELRDVDTMRKKVNNKAILNSLDSDWTNAGVKKTAENTFSQLIKPSSETVISLDHLNEANYDPNIDPVNPEKANTPDLYVYFHELWADKPDDAMDEADEIESEIDSLKNSLQESALGDVVKEDKNRVDIKREYSGGSTFSLGVGFLKAAVGLIESVIDGKFTNIRDDIFAVTYMMGMFSYDTFTNEGKWKLQSAEARDHMIGLTNYYFAYQNVEEQWADDSPEFRNNKSLTNHMICRENNAAWEAELEYILYGQSTCSENVRKAYTTIYGIRVLLNTGSAFQNFFAPGVNNTSRVFDTISSAISTACLGIIPPPVWKALLLVVLALAESGMDLLRLSRGFPLPLYKIKAEEWFLHIPDAEELKDKAETLAQGGKDAIVGALKNAVSKDKPEEKPIAVDPMPNGNKGFYYSDYLMVFLYLAITGHGDMERDMYLRMAEIIQTNMRQHEEISDAYSLSKSQVYFKLKAIIRVRPLMITLPIFDDPAYENDLDTHSDWCTYTVNTVRGYS